MVYCTLGGVNLCNGEVNNGAHFENFVAQQLTANGFEPYFCKKKNIGEMDFAIEMSGKVVPIEVKSGKAYKSHKALDHFMNVPDYHLEKAYVFSVSEFFIMIDQRKFH